MPTRIAIDGRLIAEAQKLRCRPRGRNTFVGASNRIFCERLERSDTTPATATGVNVTEKEIECDRNAKCAASLC